jgi:hypothetical protein
MSGEIKTTHLEETKLRIDDRMKIVRYMKLETLLLMLKLGWVFIPSYATLGRSDPPETGILFDLPDRWKFLEDWAPKIGSPLEKFEIARRQRERQSWASIGGGSYGVEGPGGIRANFRKYVDELAAERCVWCWNRFRNYSNALWHLYGNRGVAVTSTVGKVKAALVEAGVARGVGAPIAYINQEATKASKVLTKQENIFRPYLLKSIAFDYEKEIRFILGAQREILQDRRGVLISVKAASFIDGFRLSPHLQSEEQSIVKSMVSDLLKGTRAASKPPPLEQSWIKLYEQYSGTPFTTQDSLLNVFLDMR